LKGKEGEHLIEEATASYAKHVDPTFVKLLGLFGFGRVFVRGEGCQLWDAQGEAYLDLLAGYGSFNLGHNHPRLVARLQQLLADSPVNLSHTGPSPSAAALAKRLAELAGDPLELVLYSSSGAEAVEAGLKLARAATGRSATIACHGGYHGKSLGTLSLMEEKRFRKPFAPLLAGCSLVPFGDLDALEAALSKERVAAFVVEPIQCEGGIRIPPPGYLRAAQEACHRHGALLILDEVQTGLGRTGTLFAFQHEGSVPDVLVLAKALGGGLMPIGATLTSRAIFDRAYGSFDRFDLHDSTFAGNTLACVAALESLDLIESEDLIARSRTLGERLLHGVRQRLTGHPLVREVRGRGLLVGIDLGPTDKGLLGRLAPGLVRLTSHHVFGQWAALMMLERGFLCQPASIAWNVLRLEPPLTLSENDLERVVAALGDLFDEYRSVPKLLADAARRVGAQYQREWQFP